MDISANLPPRQFSELIICLVWQLPLPYEYALSTYRLIEDLEKKNQLYTDDNMYNIIYNCIHYNNKGYESLVGFINRLNTNSEYKEFITNELLDTNMLDKYYLYDFINKYIDMIDTIPAG